MISQGKAESVYPEFELRPKEESEFYSDPRSRFYNFKFALRVLYEFLKGFRALHFVGPCITVFGSARFKEHHPHYVKAYEFGKKIADMGGTVMTGGGPGIMEAANRGAFENGGMSVGCNIYLPHEQNFFVRKVLLLKYSYGFVVMPGGFGTMDELFETATLIQTKTIRNFPVVVFGLHYYEPLRKLLSQMIEERTISAEDMKLILFTDDVDEGIDHIRKYLRKNYYRKPVKPLPWLLERFNGRGERNGKNNR
jgi:uncharacterized protein (TIGR00730 family)